MLKLLFLLTVGLLDILELFLKIAHRGVVELFRLEAI